MNEPEPTSNDHPMKLSIGQCGALSNFRNLALYSMQTKISPNNPFNKAQSGQRSNTKQTTKNEYKIQTQDIFYEDCSPILNSVSSNECVVSFYIPYDLNYAFWFVVILYLGPIRFPKILLSFPRPTQGSVSLEHVV
jgi:hypothetical protein